MQFYEMQDITHEIAVYMEGDLKGMVKGGCFKIPVTERGKFWGVFLLEVRIERTKGRIALPEPGA